MDAAKEIILHIYPAHTFHVICSLAPAGKDAHFEKIPKYA